MFHYSSESVIVGATLATTVAMGICIGVLIFIVIALSGFLVRLR